MPFADFAHGILNGMNDWIKEVAGDLAFDHGDVNCGPQSGLMRIRSSPTSGNDWRDAMRPTHPQCPSLDHVEFVTILPTSSRTKPNRSERQGIGRMLAYRPITANSMS